MPKKQHAALKRKGLSDESAYKIMAAQKKRKRRKKAPHRGGRGGR